MHKGVETTVVNVLNSIEEAKVNRTKSNSPTTILWVLATRWALWSQPQPARWSRMIP